MHCTKQERGRLEYKRLVGLYESIRADGFNREFGHPRFLLMQRGPSYRYISAGNGNHRTAVMAALGYETMPAVFRVPGIIDVDMVDYWPQVCNGVWSRDQAIAYFNHLFDFDSLAWAREKGMLLEQVKA